LKTGFRLTFVSLELLITEDNGQLKEFQAKTSYTLKKNVPGFWHVFVAKRTGNVRLPHSPRLDGLNSEKGKIG